jgi:hypothetical protein
MINEACVRRNEERATGAGHRDAAIAAEVLSRASGLPERYVQVATARMEHPSEPWSQVAARIGMTKEQAVGVFRRFRKATSDD